MLDRVATQDNRHATVSTPLGDNKLLFYRMSMHEQLGRLYECDVQLLSDDPAIKSTDLLGQPVCVTLDMPLGGQRYFHGMVSSFRQQEMFGHYFMYRIILRPWLWFLTRTSDCRIFQEKTVPEIIKELFREYGFSDFEEKLSVKNYRKWGYCVQYRETDFNFISRMMEQEGIYFYFKHESDRHTLVLADDISSHEPIPDYENVPYFPPRAAGRSERDTISHLYESHDVQSGSYFINDYDFEKPRANLQAKLEKPFEHSFSEFEIYDYPGEYSESNDGNEYVRKRLEELHAQYNLVQGAGSVQGFIAGALFTLEDHPRDDLNKEYLVLSVNHEIESERFESGSSGSGNDLYRCSFTAMDSQFPYRSPRITPKPIVQGPQTAVVVGKPGEEIWTDKYGRVKIQFHWDREGKNDQDSSCWVRVSQPVAGKGWGAVQIPRIGQEVVVDFLEGDPDRPLITGRVYNDANMPPYDLPKAGMVSGMKSNSTPGGGGYNEMSMDDSKGKEQINIHAQYNMDSVIENNQTNTVVSGDRTLTVQSGKLTETVKLDTKLTVQAGNRIVSVTGGDYSATSTDAAVKLHGVGKGVSVTGDVEGISLTGNGKGVAVTGNGGGVKVIGNTEGVSVEGNAKGVSIIGNGDGVTIAGNPEVQCSGESAVTISAPTVNIQDGEINLTGKKITLSVGGNSVTIDSAGVTITGLAKLN